MSTHQESVAKERLRLGQRAPDDESPGGMGTVRFIARCIGNAPQVMERAKAVLKVINENSDGEWPSNDKWRELLPSWFVARCGPELSQQQAEAEAARWRSLPRDAQIRWEAERPWPLADWIYWFQPENRCWYWWDATTLNDDVLVVAVETHQWPCPSGALAWLLRAAGAQRIEAEK